MFYKPWGFQLGPFFECLQLPIGLHWARKLLALGWCSPLGDQHKFRHLRGLLDYRQNMPRVPKIIFRTSFNLKKKSGEIVDISGVFEMCLPKPHTLWLISGWATSTIKSTCKSPRDSSSLKIRDGGTWSINTVFVRFHTNTTSTLASALKLLYKYWPTVFAQK